MNRKNPDMTAKLEAILGDSQYHDPRQFTTTLYDANGKLLDTMADFEQRNWDRSYFDTFVDPASQGELLAQLRMIEAADQDMDAPLWDELIGTMPEGFQYLDDSGKPYARPNVEDE